MPPPPATWFSQVLSAVPVHAAIATSWSLKWTLQMKGDLNVQAELEAVAALALAKIAPQRLLRPLDDREVVTVGASRFSTSI